jgi:hypothetical protein
MNRIHSTKAASLLSSRMERLTIFYGSRTFATNARYLSFTVPDIEHWPEVQDASGAGAFTNEFMTTYAAQCHLTIGNRCGV